MQALRQCCLLALLVFTPLISFSQLAIIGNIDGASAGTGSVATGTFAGTLSSDLKTLTYQITYGKLEGTFQAAHFHSALTGGIVQAITFTGNTATGTWSNIPDSLSKLFFSGNIYVNIHSSTESGGEIRGNLFPRQLAFIMKLDGTQAGTGSAGKGTGYATLSEGGTGDIEYRITFAGLTGTYSQAHFHALPSTGIVHGFTTPDSVTISGTWSNPPDSAYSLFLRNNIYINIHSTTSPGGEIRSNAVPTGELPFIATLDGAQASTASTAKGTAWAVLNAADLSVRYHATYAQLGGTYQQAHFHTRTNASIVHGVSFAGNATTTGPWTSLSDVNLQDLVSGRIYLNIHSTTSPGGEIAGDLMYYDGVMVASLDGQQASTASNGKGTAWLYFDGDSVRYRMTIAGLTGTFSAAHFHYGPTTGILQAITFSDSNATGVWGVADSMVNVFVRGDVYINVHSSTSPGGEIRGDLKIGLGPVTSVVDLDPTLPQDFRLLQNYPNPFNPATTVAFSLTRTEKVTLRVYNLLGQVVATPLNEVRGPGTHTIVFEASGLTSGVYFYRLETSTGLVETKRMVLIR
ncbi:MAG: CHRD domain-containing protein [Bacteroidota bacterium]